jgi:hypothetical protein
MAYTFRIVFGGLCALVPREKDHELDILLVNTQHPRADRLNHKPPRHVPRLEFDLADLTGGPGGPHKSAHGYWRLEFEDLAISAKGSPQPLTFEGKLNQIKSGKAGKNHDFAWIPSLKSVCPAIGKIEADCFAVKPSTDARKGFIVGRLALKQGKARIHAVSAYRGSEVVTEFVPKPDRSSAARAAMPHLAEVSSEVDDGEVVTLTATRFDGKKKRTLRLGPAEPGGEIEVYLTNLCCGGYQDEDPSQLPKEDDDFECFYILYDNFDTLRVDLPQLPLPVPVEFASKVNPKGTAGGGHPIECSMARLEA